MNMYEYVMMITKPAGHTIFFANSVMSNLRSPDICLIRCMCQAELQWSNLGGLARSKGIGQEARDGKRWKVETLWNFKQLWIVETLFTSNMIK